MHEKPFELQGPTNENESRIDLTIVLRNNLSVPEIPKVTYLKSQKRKKNFLSIMEDNAGNQQNLFHAMDKVMHR